MVEKTPTARIEAEWWWTQSLPITFADAGAALQGMSYVSANQPAAIMTPTPVPTVKPTPKPTPRPTARLLPPSAPRRVTIAVNLDGYKCNGSTCEWPLRLGWVVPPGEVTGYRV